ncbi:MAG: hypothetical protein G8345_14080, partial [Magnetococcales bacterium]|nr:hypothetical protein [Magnetococcales bacterium]
MRRFIMMVLLLPGCVQDLTLGRSGLRPLDESSPVAASALLPASPPSRILTLAGLPEVHTGIVVIPADVVHVARAGQTDQSLSAPTVSTETSKTVTLQFDSNQTQPRRESLLILTRVIE